MKKVLLLFLLNLFLHASRAQSLRFFVAFKDKDTSLLNRPLELFSQRGIERRAKFKIPVTQDDIPVKTEYLKAIEEKGGYLLSSTRWFNGVVVGSRNANFPDSIKSLPFVKSVSFIGHNHDTVLGRKADLGARLSELESKFSKTEEKKDSNYYGKSYNQLSVLNLPALHRSGYDGKGVVIAVFDAGFRNADKIEAFKQLFSSERILGTYDFSDGDEQVFDEDEHGTAVLSCMAAGAANKLVGSAPAASYWLFRTEDVYTEFPVEEYNWASAAEFADSLGADIISSSVGYTEFDDVKLGHRYKELDGKTTVITRAANMAAARGMLVLNSAGNEGNNYWRQLAAPADAEKIITVASVNEKGSRSGFSSMGLTAGRKQKPDVAAMGEQVAVVSDHGIIYKGNGTSYSCPILAGAMACILQKHPAKTPEACKEALLLGSSNYYDPDKYIGYGIPDMVLTDKLLGDFTTDTILDLRSLADKFLHVAFSTTKEQKISISILKPGSSKETWNDKQKVKAGINRLPLKGYRKLKSGTHLLRIITEEKVLEIDFMKN